MEADGVEECPYGTKMKTNQQSKATQQLTTPSSFLPSFRFLR